MIKIGVIGSGSVGIATALTFAIHRHEVICGDIDKEKVDLLILISERGLAANLELVETYPGIDIVLSSDMHEQTPAPVVTTTGSLIVEQGQDGTRLGELRLGFEGKKLISIGFGSTSTDLRIKKMFLSIRPSSYSRLARWAHRNGASGYRATRASRTRAVCSPRVSRRSSRRRPRRKPSRARR